MDVMTETVDLSGPVYEGMWHYADPYFGPSIRRQTPPEWLSPPVYWESVSMPLQTGTYLESSAHCFEGDPGVNDYPVSRWAGLPTVSVFVPKGPGEAIVADDLAPVIDALCPDGTEGMGLLVGTGWDSHWRLDDFTTACPFFDDSAADLVIERGFSLFGGDSPRFENPEQPSGHLRRIFAAKILLLAPLCNLSVLGNTRGLLTAAPLSIAVASASPTRALFTRTA
jgi:kynurenine formamidase